MSEPRVRLSGGPAGSASWVYWSSEGAIVVELYDHGAEAEASFGHDVAFLVTVAPSDVEAVQRRLAVGADALFEAMAARFSSYFEVKAWLEAEGIPFQKDFDSWA